MLTPSLGLESGWLQQHCHYAGRLFVSSRQNRPAIHQLAVSYRWLHASGVHKNLHMMTHTSTKVVTKQYLQRRSLSDNAVQNCLPSSQLQIDNLNQSNETLMLKAGSRSSKVRKIQGTGPLHTYTSARDNVVKAQSTWATAIFFQ